MKKLSRFLRAKRGLIISICVIALVFFAFRFFTNDTTPSITSTVTIGDVAQIISVSGTAKAVNTASLAFPIPGILESVSVSEGQEVLYGDTLATLIHTGLKAEYQSAVAELLIAYANQSESLSGARPEARSLSEMQVEVAKTELMRVTSEFTERVENARRTLLSADLVAKPLSMESEKTPPIISGTYTCEEGTYTLETFRSGAKSGYSYYLRGIESGTYTAYTETSAPMGVCGLTIQFAADVSYGTSLWSIEIPNTNSPSYVANSNAYSLAKINRENAMRLAEQQLRVAQQTDLLQTAEPRSETISRDEARVLQARARLAVLEAQIDNYILKAPFNGVVANLHGVKGEVSGSAPVVTLISDEVFTVNALIPEIDITKINIGQRARAQFDASPDELVEATITFVSPLAREIGGVSYFETTLTLESTPSWMRGGLNADIEIIIEKYANVLRIPARFLIQEENEYFVLVPNRDSSRKIPVAVSFIGNDGFAHVEGIAEGDIIISP